jgi:hypothetical protein
MSNDIRRTWQIKKKENNPSNRAFKTLNKSTIVLDKPDGNEVLKGGLLKLKPFTANSQVPAGVAVGTLARSSDSDTKLLVAQQVGEEIIWLNKSGGSGGSASFSTIQGAPHDNTSLGAILDSKLNIDDLINCDIE